jgi:hypothetical protein
MAHTTRGDFIDYVIRTLKRDDKETELIDALHSIIRDISARHSFQVLRRQEYVPLRAQQEDYPFPVEMQHWHQPVRILQGQESNADGYVLKQIGKEEYDSLEPNPNRTNPSGSDPYAFCIFQNAFLLTSIPTATHEAAAWRIEINCGVFPTIPTADDQDAHPFGQTWDETLKWGILHRIYSDLGLNDEAEKWGSYYEVGSPRVVGGTVVGYVGGVANMIELDMHSDQPPQFVAYNDV